MTTEQAKILRAFKFRKVKEKMPFIWADDSKTGSTLCFDPDESPREMVEHIRESREAFKQKGAKNG